MTYVLVSTRIWTQKEMDLASNSILMSAFGAEDVLCICASTTANGAKPWGRRALGTHGADCNDALGMGSVSIGGCPTDVHGDVSISDAGFLVVGSLI